jgi:hypothetical protein
MEENLKKSIEAMMSAYGPTSDPNKFNQLNYERDINLFTEAFGKDAMLDLTDQLGPAMSRRKGPPYIEPYGYGKRGKVEILSNEDINRNIGLKDADTDLSTSAARGLSNYEQYLLEQQKAAPQNTANVFGPKINTPNFISPIKTKTTSGLIEGLNTPIGSPSFLPSKNVSEAGTSLLLDRGPKIPKKFGDTKLGGAFKGLFKDDGTKFLQKGTEASKTLKATGVGLASSLIRPEQLLRTDKEGLRTEYGFKDVAGRGLQTAKGFGLLALGDPVGGLLEIGQGAVGLFTDAFQVKKDRKTEEKMKRDESRKKLQDELLARSEKRATGNLEDKQAVMERYGMVGEKGMITPTNMGMGMSSFLSDGYKMYLSRNNEMNVEMAGGGHLRTHSLGLAAHSRPLDLRVAKEYKNGGMVKGPSHKRGGVKFNVGGEVVELEGGEAVINKKSTKMFRDVLSQINQAGGGVRFEKGGMLKY